MTVHIALPRAVNLGSHKKVSMADLRKMIGDLGFTDVQSYINSGNLVFKGSPSGAKLEALLEDEAEKRVGLATEWIVRSAAEWQKIIAANPFKKEAKTAPNYLYVFACKKAPGSSPKITGRTAEVVKVKGKEIYAFFPKGMGQSRMKIHEVTTARNWNTVLKLGELSR